MTKIEWTDYTWNPWWGCSEIAPECGQHDGGEGFCYAAVFAGRGIPKGDDDQPMHAGVAQAGKWTGKITRSGDAVWQAPFKWRSGRVFASSMTDFWHEGVPLPWLDETLDVMDRTPRLTYQILSKRPGNIARRLADLKRRLPANVWLGATIGHAKSLPLLKPLLRIDATLRLLSCEPLLTGLPDLKLDGIGWLIGGGQSGWQAAYCDPAWMRGLRDLCIVSSVPFFLKQWGTWESNPTPREQEMATPKTKGGATLDGRLWRQFPESRDHR
jgi:protein gp37